MVPNFTKSLPPEVSVNILGGTIRKAELDEVVVGEVDPNAGGDDLGEDDVKEAPGGNGGEGPEVGEIEVVVIL